MRREPPARPAASGFFGKIPARGDFVGAGLPRSFVEPWDDWLRAAIAGSRALLGAAWLPAWLEAPVWRFALPAGMCGPDPVLGAWMPSVDRAGRHFPLTLAALLPGATPEAMRAQGGPWLDAVVAIGRAALERDLPPDRLTALLPATPPSPAAPAAMPAAGLWWTDGSPRVPPGCLRLPGLPDGRCFAGMIDAAHMPRPRDAEERMP